MRKIAPDFPRTAEFMKYAASSCGTPAELHGKQEVIGPGAEVTLELPQPFAASAFCRAHLPPIVVRVGHLCLVNEYEMTEEEQHAQGRGQKVKTLRPANELRIFEGQTIRSIHQTVREGDTVIGLAATGLDKISIVNADNAEDLAYLLATYDDQSCMQHVAL